MKFKVKELFIIWVCSVLFISIISISSVIVIRKSLVEVSADAPKETEVEAVIKQKSISEVENMLSVPRVEKGLKEVEYTTDKEIEKLKFPFETLDKGIYKVKGVYSKTLPQRLYSGMKAKSNITVFASKNVMPEGTLLWIEGIGIRQVQTVYSDDNVIYVYFDTEQLATDFGEKDVRVYEITE